MCVFNTNHTSGAFCRRSPSGLSGAISGFKFIHVKSHTSPNMGNLGSCCSFDLVCNSARIFSGSYRKRTWRFLVETKPNNQEKLVFLSNSDLRKMSPPLTSNYLWHRTKIGKNCSMILPFYMKMLYYRITACSLFGFSSDSTKKLWSCEVTKKEARAFHRIHNVERLKEMKLSFIWSIYYYVKILFNFQ